VALVELPETGILELSAAAAALLGPTTADGIGLDYLAVVVERPEEAQHDARRVTMGVVDAIHARRQFRRPDGSTIDLPTCGRAIRSGDGGDLGLWVAGAAATKDPSPGPDLLAEGGRGPTADGADRSSSRVTLDGRWRVEGIDTDDDEVLGYRPVDLVGTSLIALVHPDDLAVLLLAFARVTTGIGVSERLRLCCRDGTWHSVAVVVSSLDGDGPLFFSLALTDVETSPALNGSRVGQLEHHLRRIALELQAAGVVLGPIEDDGFGVTATMSGLSARQQEVLSRLLRGERVPRIAKAMYLSQSTVRNHLSVIFRKAGVHSQEALLAQLRHRALVDPSTRE
jgi:DNA-binding CsgD family transcriptional regulator/PAS domain-containing protein